MAKSMRTAYAEALIELGGINEKLVVLDADLGHTTMTCMFKDVYPEKHFNFGIAEANMVCASAGFAKNGLVPFVSTMAMFGAGRAFEQIRNTVCYMNANVKFGFSHPGISVGADGGSHQTIEDIAIMRCLPNMKIFTPCDCIEMRKAVLKAAEIDGPVYIRISRPDVENVTSEDAPFVPGKATILRDGTDVCIMAIGLMVHEALKAAEMLEKEGISAAVVSFGTVKPLDKEMILNMAGKVKGIVTAEEHTVLGGFGSAVAEVACGQNVKFAMVGIEDRFGQSGQPDELFKAYGLTAENIYEKCKNVLK